MKNKKSQIKQLILTTCIGHQNESFKRTWIRLTKKKKNLNSIHL